MWTLRRRDPRIRDEMRYHRDRLIDDYVAAGMDRAEAERRAFLEFGNVAALEESVRDARGRWLDDLGKDLVYAIRTLRRSPAFSLVAVLSLALGIGANATIFSIINAAILRTLPVDDPGRLVQITRQLDGRPGRVSYPVFERFRDRITSVSGVFVQQSTTQAAAIDGNEEPVAIDLVSGQYFGVLGIDAAAGRVFGPADDVVAPPAHVAVITDRFWLRRFGRSSSAIGKPIVVADLPFTIVGVMPPSFGGVRRSTPPDLILPLLPMLPERARTQAGFNALNLLARLKPGARVEQALAEARVLYQPIAEAQAAEATSRQERAAMLRQQIIALHSPNGFNPVGDTIREPLLILMGIVGLILLLACVNVSGLLLARAAARQREISIRLAIGAGRGRLVRQFLTESFVLAIAGGIAGYAIAGGASARLFALFINNRPIELSVAPDPRVLAFTAVLSVAACILAGLVPAWHAFKVRLSPGLKDVPAHGHGRLGRSLVVAQLAMSMILVVGASLFIATLVKLYAVDRGFDSDGLLVVQTGTLRQLPDQRARSSQQSLLERLKTLPGVRAVSAGAILPVGGGLWTRGVRVEGHASQGGEPESVAFNPIAPGYFTAFGTPLRAGREFTAYDTSSSPFVAVVNDSFARAFFGTRSAIGQHVTTVGLTYEIVGIVGDTKYQALREPNLRTMYIPWTQLKENQEYGYLLRVIDGTPLRLSSAIESTVREVEPSMRVVRISTYAAWIDESIPTERLMATVGGVIALLGLVLAGVGVFGVLAFQVARRTNELGVRTVLGASRWSMMRLVLRDVVAMLVPGIAIGAAVALMATGVTRSLLFGLTPTDPTVFIFAASILSAAALVAGWLPARRASSVDPLVALRHE